MWDLTFEHTCLCQACFGVWFVRSRAVPWQGLLKTFTVMALTYIMWFKLHFIMLAKTGDRESAFVPVEFSEPYQKTLLNNPAYDVST